MNRDFMRRIARAFLCILLIICSLEQKPAEGRDTDIKVSVDEATIFDYTYQVLDRLRVDDERGIWRIRKLNPPAYQDYPNELTWFNNLRMWLRENIKHGKGSYTVPIYPPPLIELMRSSKSRPVTCGFFSIAYAGLLLAFDIPVRLIHVYGNSTDGEMTSHTFNEVWSEEYQKWIVQDVDYNIFWMNEERLPVSSFEIQREIERCGGNVPCYRMRPYEFLGGKPLSEKIPTDVFHRLVISFQANFYQAFGVDYLEHQVGFLFHLRTKDEIEDNDLKWLNVKKILNIKSTEDQRLLYAPLNQIIVAGIDEGDRLRIYLKNNILNFDHYEVKRSSKGWESLDRRQRGFYCEKELCDEEREIMIRGVSKHGHRTKPWRVLITPMNLSPLDDT